MTEVEVESCKVLRISSCKGRERGGEGAFCMAGIRESSAGQDFKAPVYVCMHMVCISVYFYESRRAFSILTHSADDWEGVRIFSTVT